MAGNDNAERPDCTDITHLSKEEQAKLFDTDTREELKGLIADPRPYKGIVVFSVVEEERDGELGVEFRTHMTGSPEVIRKLMARGAGDVKDTLVKNDPEFADKVKKLQGILDTVQALDRVMNKEPNKLDIN
jgi:hypothetical protein